MVIKGSLESVTDLPLVGASGEMWLVGGSTYVWIGNKWELLGVTGASGIQRAYYPYSSSETLTRRKEIVESKLTWKGISVTIHSENDIKGLFFTPDNLTREDMAIFQMTYPEDFTHFRQEWTENWAIETAKDEFDSWGDDYYEKKKRRNY